jgi:threonine dehydrogenase-like Zn-dependent dehydrogenase
MKSLVYKGPEQLAFQDMPDPIPIGEEKLIKIDSVGICGSDMHAFLGFDERRPAPLILGHEVSGMIVDGAEQGRSVTLNPLVGCGRCPACVSGRDNLCPDRQIISMPPKEGGFAQYISMRMENLTFVPDGFSLEKACMAEPIACGWHAVRLAKAALGSQWSGIRALVIGGGGIGVGAALSLIAQGIQNVTLIEPNEIRREFLTSGENFSVIAPEALGDDDYDLVIDGVGYALTRATASKAVRPGGVIMHIGLGSAEGGLDIRRATLQEITFIGTYAYTAADFRAAAAAMFDGRLGALEWYEARPLAQGAQAFADIRQGQVAAPKIILKP